MRVLASTMAETTCALPCTSYSAAAYFYHFTLALCQYTVTHNVILFAIHENVGEQHNCIGSFSFFSFSVPLTRALLDCVAHYKFS